MDRFGLGVGDVGFRTRTALMANTIDYPAYPSVPAVLPPGDPAVAVGGPDPAQLLHHHALRGQLDRSRDPRGHQ